MRDLWRRLVCCVTLLGAAGAISSPCDLSILLEWGDTAEVRLRDRGCGSGAPPLGYRPLVRITPPIAFIHSLGDGLTVGDGVSWFD